MWRDRYGSSGGGSWSLCVLRGGGVRVTSRVCVGFRWLCARGGPPGVVRLWPRNSNSSTYLPRLWHQMTTAHMMMDALRTELECAATRSVLGANRSVASVRSASRSRRPRALTVPTDSPPSQDSPLSRRDENDTFTIYVDQVDSPQRTRNQRDDERADSDSSDESEPPSPTPRRVVLGSIGNVNGLYRR